MAQPEVLDQKKQLLKCQNLDQHLFCGENDEAPKKLWQCHEDVLSQVTGSLKMFFSRSRPKLLSKFGSNFTHQKRWFNGGLMGFNQQNGGFNGIYPLVNCHITMENHHFLAG